MELFVKPLLYCFFVVFIVVAVWTFIKRLQRKAVQNLSADLSDDVIRYLKSGQNRRKAQSEDVQKIKTGTNKKIVLYFLMMFCILFLLGIIEGFGRTYLLAMISVTIVLGIAFSTLMTLDKKRLSSSYDGGIWIEKAYILNVLHYKGYNLTIVYFDFFENEVKPLNIQIDTEDVNQMPQKGDYINVVLAAKRSDLKYCCVAKEEKD